MATATYPDVPSNYATRLGLRWTLYTGGRTEALVRAARSTAGAAAEDVRVAQADLRLDVARAFWTLVSADALVAVLRRGVDRSPASRAVVSAFVNPGYFEVPFRGSVGLLLLISLVYLMTTLGIGLFVSSCRASSSRSRTCRRRYRR